MAIQLGTTYRSALLNQFMTTAGSANAKLVFLTGTQPGNCATGDSGNVVASILLPNTWLTTSSTGSLTMAGSWTVSASGSGTVGYFRIKDSGSTVHMQGSVTATGNGGDMTVDNTNVAQSQTITVSTFNLTAPGA